MNPPEAKTQKEKMNMSRLEILHCKSGAAQLRNGQVCRFYQSGGKRILGGESADFCYHVMSKTCGSERMFDAEDKEALRIIIRKLALFSGIKVLTYCLLDNHWHILVRIPSREKFLRQFNDKDNEEPGAGETRLIAHLSTLYSKAYIQQLKLELVKLRKEGMAEEAQHFLEKYKRRFCDLSLYIKEVKERFSRWYNQKHDRMGTLWMGRFKSVLVENGEALRVMAAYIDLNPVRAGIVTDPKDYRWCGYAEAVAGSRHARRGLCWIMGKPQDSWDKNESWYRCWLMTDGQEIDTNHTEINHHDSKRSRKGTPSSKAKEALEKAGELSKSQQLMSRMKYLTEGAAIGSKSFVATFFIAHRHKFGPTRKKKAKALFNFQAPALPSPSYPPSTPPSPNPAKNQASTTNADQNKDDDKDLKPQNIHIYSLHGITQKE